MKTHKIVLDLEQMRPACALLQVAQGADRHIAARFPVTSLLTELTPGLMLYTVTDEELDKLVALVHATPARRKENAKDEVSKIK